MKRLKTNGNQKALYISEAKTDYFTSDHDCTEKDATLRQHKDVKEAV